MWKDSEKEPRCGTDDSHQGRRHVARLERVPEPGDTVNPAARWASFFCFRFHGIPFCSNSCSSRTLSGKNRAPIVQTREDSRNIAEGLLVGQRVVAHSFQFQLCRNSRAKLRCQVAAALEALHALAQQTLGI